MSWICPNKCHKSVPGWHVIRRKAVEECYLYAVDDKNLSVGKLQVGACIGNTHEKPMCSTCTAYVMWEEPPAASKANVYQVTWEAAKGGIFTTAPTRVCFAGGDVIAEHIIVLASFRARLGEPSEVARIVKVEICEKDPT